jgi:hypothetical protein
MSYDIGDGYYVDDDGNIQRYAVESTSDYTTTSGDNSSSGFNFNLKDITKLLSGGSDLGTAGQLAGVASIYALMNKLGGGLGQTGQGIYRGYQGGIPNYTATRTMNPIPQTMTVPSSPGSSVSNIVPRRPGSGGVTYFTPMTYTPVATAAPTVTAAPTTTAVPAAGGGLMASGGISTLGGYSDGGRLLKGPGDGVSDSIPATIGGKQPARLADGEFVIPARIVSEIGNGSTEAGAKKLYAMMDRVQKARKKSVKNVAANTKADKYLPK